MAADLHPVRRTIVGPALGIANALDTAAREGRLVSVSPPRPHAPEMYAVTAVLLERSQPPVAPSKFPAPTRVSPAVFWAAAGVLAASIMVAVVIVAVRWVIGHWPVVVGALAVAVVLVGLLRQRTGACMGLHCFGCGHR